MFMLTKLSQCLPAGVDACLQGHDCQHVCVPHGDSYLCECHRGFVLNADRKSCARKFGSCCVRLSNSHPNSSPSVALAADRRRSWIHLQVSRRLDFPVVTKPKTTNCCPLSSPPLGLRACAHGHECQHICVDSNDSYTCRCHEGFVLNADQRTCSRKSSFSSNDLKVPKLQLWLPVALSCQGFSPLQDQPRAAGDTTASTVVSKMEILTFARVTRDLHLMPT